MGIRNITRIKVRGVPLWIIIVCGLAGVLVDVDHIIAYELNIPDHRFAHSIIAIISIIIICGFGAYYGGLYLKLVLKKNHKSKQTKNKNKRQ